MPRSREQFDVLDFEGVQDWLPTLNPDLVIHTASFNNIVDAESKDKREEVWRLNALATDNLVRTCAAAGIPLMLISSDQVFGSDTQRKTPYREGDVPGPTSWYGQTKAAAEHSLLYIGQCMCPEYWSGKFRYWIIRTANLFDRMDRESKSNLAYRASAQRNTLALADNLTSFTYVPHLAGAVKYLVEHHKEIASGVYHVANSGRGSYYDFASRLSSVSQKYFNVVPEDRNSFFNTTGTSSRTVPIYSVLDGTNFHKQTGGPVLPSWQDALEECCGAVLAEAE